MYVRTDFDLGVVISVSEAPRQITVASALGQHLIAQGLRMKGDETPQPALFPNGEVAEISYCLRWGLNQADAPDINWESFGFAGKPMFWGCCSVLMDNRPDEEYSRILMGLKRQKGRVHIFSGTFTNVGAGIVELEAGKTLEQLLEENALRELQEETNGSVTADMVEVLNTVTFVDDQRGMKPEALTYMRLKSGIEVELTDGSEEFEFFRWIGGAEDLKEGDTLSDQAKVSLGI